MQISFHFLFNLKIIILFYILHYYLKVNILYKHVFIFYIII